MKKMTIAIAVSSIAFALPAAAQTTSPGKNPSTAPSPSSSPSTSTSSHTGSDAKQGAKNAMLTAKVHAAMAKDPGLKTLAINVDSAGNDITLKGQVDSEATRSRAEQAAKKVEGVGTVHNELTIKPKG